MKGKCSLVLFAGTFQRETAFAVAGNAIAKVFPSIKVKYNLLVNSWSTVGKESVKTFFEREISIHTEDWLRLLNGSQETRLGAETSIQ
jgi:hypothetical protein